MCSSSENPFLRGSPLDIIQKVKPTVLVRDWISSLKPSRLEVLSRFGTGPEVGVNPHVSWDQGCHSGGLTPTSIIAQPRLTGSFIACLCEFLV